MIHFQNGVSVSYIGYLNIHIVAKTSIVNTNLEI